MSVYRLLGRARHYDWGGTEFIPRLIGAQADGRPFAEYWLGAHPDSPSQVRLGEDAAASLHELIASDPGRWLGRDAGRFEALPFLFKVLDVAAPLSIQVHPDRDQARAGFDREDALGIPRDAPHRNFRDRNPKPELAVALDQLWLLYGFRPAERMGAELARFPSLSALGRALDSGGIGGLFEAWMRADGDTLRRWLVPVFEAVRENPSADPACPDYWIGAWLGQGSPGDRADRGVIGFLVMNLLRLRAGEGIYQAANVPHAYLRGHIVEIMANSDNVLRCGLTNKHVDPEALLAHVDFSAATPEVIEAMRSGDRVDYACPVDEFLLTRAEIGVDDCTHRAESLEIWLVIEGRCEIDNGTTLTLDRGQAAIVEAGTRFIAHGQPTADVFIARVPGR